MPSLYDRLNQVRWLGRRARDAALVATLPHASSQERDAIVLEMIEIAATSPASRHLFGTLLRNWRLLSRDARKAVLNALGSDLLTVFSKLRTSSDPADRQAAALIAVAAVVSPADRQPAAPLSDSGTDATVIDPFDPAIRQEFDAALADAARQYAENRQDNVMDAIVRCAHNAGPNLRAWLEDEQQVGHMALRAAAKRLPRRRQTESAVRWLAIKPLRSVGADVIESFTPAELQTGLLDQVHLLRARRRATLGRRISRSTSLLPNPASVMTLSESQRRAALALAKLAGRSDDAVREYMSAFLTDPSAMVRLDAVSILGQLAATPQTDVAILDFAFDSSEWVAAKAAGFLVNAESTNRRRAMKDTIEMLTRAPHRRVRALANAALLELDPFADVSDAWRCPIAARRALSIDRGGFIRELVRRATEHSIAERIAMFELADRLNMLESIESVLIRAAHDLDRKVASKATVLLGKLPGDGPREVIRAALRNSDERIRANAVEALATQEPDDPRIEVLMTDPAPRVRANALRALLGQPQRARLAEHALAEMLIDDRPSHRVSALWVTERTARTALASRVADLASSDDSPEVHERAQRCARRLLAEMRAGWTKASLPKSTVEVLSSPLANAG